MKPKNFPEALIWYAILGTYGFYLIGGLYFVGPMIAWILLVYLGWRLYQQSHTPSAQPIIIPWVIWVWVGGMLIEELALIMGHFDFQLGTVQLIKSSIGWAKGWALLALFPLLGCLPIRPQMIIRAVCMLGLQTLLIAPLLILASLAHLDPTLYTSPLSALGGVGDLPFHVRLYFLEYDGGVRFSFFGPWAPAIGLVGNIYFFLALQEKHPKWRWLGIIGSLLMCLMSVSRLAILCLPFVFLATVGIQKLFRPLYLILAGVGVSLFSVAIPFLIDVLTGAWDQFRGSRLNSSQVREALQRIALRRFQEAPIWGHGTFQPGPSLVKNMPIGSHHTIYSLLFVKGIVGLAAFVVPMVCSFIDLLRKVGSSETARAGLQILLVLTLFAFAENLEGLAYLYWPGLIIMGIAFQERIEAPNTPYNWSLQQQLHYSNSTR